MAARLSVRRATAADAPRIANLAVRAWDAAYRGLLPDAVLDARTVAEEEKEWRAYLDDEPEGFRTWLTRDGFARTGPSDDAARAGEVYGLYVEPDRIGTGAGRALFAHAVEDLAARGFPLATVWVFEGNERALRFYATAGFEPDGGRRLDPGFGVPELRLRRTLSSDWARAARSFCQTV